MTDRTSRRRRFLHLAGVGGIAWLTGCSDLRGAISPDGDGSPGPTGTAGPTATPTRTETAQNPTETAEGTPEGTSEETPGSDGDGTDDSKGPGYKNNHWHGRLFFEVNGELVDFRQPKYYLENIEDDNLDAVYFHFHKEKDEHGPNEWSNEKQIITFARALDLLPGIEYERSSGAHVITYGGTTYDARRSGTSISIHNGTEPIDPTSHEVAHNDNYWVQIVTGDAKRNVSPAHGGATLGTLLFDINNVRVDFSRQKYLDGGSESFHFHDDGHPYLWYEEGEVTLQEALNSLPGISYERSGGNHVVEYHDEKNVAHSRRFDGGSSKHKILVRQRTTNVDPTSYQLAAGDIIWVYVHSELAPDNEH